MCNFHFDIFLLLYSKTIFLVQNITIIFFKFCSLAIKTGRYTHEKRTRDIREIKRLQNQVEVKEEVEESPSEAPEKTIIVNEEFERLAEHMDNAQKTMYGPLLGFWTNQKAIFKLTDDYAVSMIIAPVPVDVHFK